MQRPTKHGHDLSAAASAACAPLAGQAGYAAIIPAPFGVLGLRTCCDRLSGIDFLPPGFPPMSPVNAFAWQAAQQLAAYFRDPTTVFDLPFVLIGTPYRLRVWQAIRQIACGKTRTYGELAAALGSAPRAVGQAVGDNPLPILVPCHRVVARHGLGGFAHADSGPSLAIKHWLLRHEGALAD